MRFRPSFAFLFIFGLLALNSCGGYGLQSTTVAPTTATIRFINGAPTVPSLDFALSLGAGSIVGLAYQSISVELVVAAGPYDITSVLSGTTIPFVTQKAFNAVAGQHYVFVATGTAASPSFVPFTEPIFSTLVEQAAVNFHDASPKSGTAAIPVGTFKPTLPTLQLGTMTLGGQTGPILLTLENLVDATTTVPSTSVHYFAISPAAVPFAASAADSSDANGVLPFGSDHNLQLYLIDAPAGSAAPGLLVGTFDLDG
jgi:hypothetical protein